MALNNSIQDKDRSDDELVGIYQASPDMEVLTILFLRYSDMLFAVCIKYLKDPELSKDAVLDIYEQLGPKLQKFAITNFRSWLYTIGKNHCLMQLRSAKNVKVIELNPDFMHSTEEMHLNGITEREQNLDRLEACIKTLPEDQQRAVTLFYLESKCYKEISELTGMEWNMIRSYIQNGRRNLKLCMERNATIASSKISRIKESEP